MAVTSIRLNSEIEAPLEDLANKLDRSKNYLINQAIKEYLKRQAMEESRWEDTLDALSSIKAGKSIKEEKVADWINSWGNDNEKTSPNS